MLANIVCKMPFSFFFLYLKIGLNVFIRKLLQVRNSFGLVSASCLCSLSILTLSSLQTSTDTNSADKDEMAHNELSPLDLHCFPFCLLIFDQNPYLQQWMCPTSEMEESILETQKCKG